MELAKLWNAPPHPETVHSIDKSTKIVHSLMKFMIQKMKMELPESKFPAVLQEGKQDSEYIEHGDISYGITANVIFYRLPLEKTDLKKYAGNAFGEEIGHFLRSYHTGKIGKWFFDLQEMTVQEFFGFLSRKALLKFTQEEGWSDQVFTDDELWAPAEKETVKEQLQKQREAIRNSIFPRRIAKWIQKDERINILAHHRGYQWANMMDVEQVGNWQNLFSMSNDEIQSRFFRPDQNYAGLEQGQTE